MSEARWEALGIYDPTMPKAAERRQLIEFLLDRGATEQQMVEAEQTFGLAGLISELVRGWSPPSISVRAAAETAGIAPNDVRRMWLAQGLTLPADDETACLRPGDVRLLEIGAAGIALFGLDATLGFVRSLASGVALIGEAAQDVFNTAVADRYAARSELEYAQAAEAAVGLEALIIEAMALAYPLHAEQRTSRFRAARGKISRGASTMRRSVGFVDLVGSTQLANSASLAEYSEALDDFESAAFKLATDRGVRIVKLIGDEVMFVASSAEDAALYAGDLIAAARGLTNLSGARGGIATGEVLGRSGDLFGPVVNLAARATSTAQSLQVLADADTVDELPPASWTVESQQRVALRGFNVPVVLHAIAQRH